MVIPWVHFSSLWLEILVLGAFLAKGEETFDTHHISLSVSSGPAAGRDFEVEVDKPVKIQGQQRWGGEVEEFYAFLQAGLFPASVLLLKKQPPLTF